MNVIQILFQGVFPKRSLSSIKIVQALEIQNEFIQFCISKALPVLLKDSAS